MTGNNFRTEIENDLHHTATHEAGHAVIARVLTLSCAGASVVPDYEDGAAGYSLTDDPWQCVSEWERRGKVRGPDAVWHARIMMAMAGAEGEIELLGSTHGGAENADRAGRADTPRRCTWIPDLRWI
jgi:hypothetical protein